MNTIKIKMAEGTEGLQPPCTATSGSAGFDLRCRSAFTLNPGQFLSIPCGIHLEMPYGLEGQVRPRSGLAKKHGVTVLNSPGTIDADFRGEVSAILINHGSEAVSFDRGDRIAQIVFATLASVQIDVTTEDLNPSDRGMSGFGSTGIG